MDRLCEEHPGRNAAGFCVKCGRALCEDCLQKISGRNFCTACLGEDLRRTREAAGGPAAGRNSSARGRITPDRPRPSRQSFPVTGQELRRVVATALDLVLLLVVSFPFSWLLMQLTILPFREVHGIGFTLSFYFVMTLFSSVYFIVGHWKYGKTIGKFLLGLKVVDNEGAGRITLGQSFWRWTGFMAGGIWAYIGYWMSSKAVGWISIFRDKLPGYFMTLALVAGVVLTGFFSLGLLMTFIGKYKRGFHDLLGATIVKLDESGERR